MPLLHNKVALVTGSASGIGQCTAELFAREGAKVVVFDWNGKGAEEVAAGIRGAGGAALAAPGDVRSREDILRALQQAEESFGLSTFSSTTPASTRATL